MSMQEPVTVLPPGDGGTDPNPIAGVDSTASPDEANNVRPIHNVFPPDEQSGDDPKVTGTNSSLVPVTSRPAGAWWAWHPLHGGTGITTLARAVLGGIELDGLPAEHGWPNLPVVAVIRSHHAGLVAAQEFAKAVTDDPGMANVVGLVVIADAPRLHRQLADHLRLVSGAYDHVWRIPWVRAWRLGEPVAQANVPRNALALLSDLAERCEMPLIPTSNTEQGDKT